MLFIVASSCVIGALDFVFAQPFVELVAPGQPLRSSIHHTEKDVPCELMGDIRVEDFTRLTREDWEKAVEE